MRMKDQVAIVTGGSKGIGLGIVEEFLKEGAKVLFCSRNLEQGQQTLKSLKELGEVAYMQCDVSDIAQLQALVDKAVEIYGKLDVFVSNAGINDPKKTNYLDITPESYDKIMDVNLKALFFGDQFAARQMKKQGTGGAIINISSVNAYLALDSQMVYTTSKGGVQQLTKVQAVSLNPYNIKVNAICPGPIMTELMQRVGSDKQLMDTIVSRTPIGRIGSITECGRLAVFLATSDSDFIFGQSIYNDGGRSFQAFPVPGYKTVDEKDYELLQQIKEK